jgi:hypothetical protein
METEPNAPKQALHSRSLEQTSDERLRQAEQIIKVCQETVRKSHEIVQDAKKALARARDLKRR